MKEEFGLYPEKCCIAGNIRNVPLPKNLPGVDIFDCNLVKFLQVRLTVPLVMRNSTSRCCDSYIISGRARNIPPASRAHELLYTSTHSLRCRLEECRQLRWLSFLFHLVK